MTKTEQKAESAANKLIAFGRRSEHKAKDAATEIKHEKRVIAERAREFAQSGPGMAVIGTAAAYVTLRGGIALFHRMRRNFLRQLMEDVSTALDRLGATYWLDFGALLGVYRDGDLILHDNDVDFAVMDPDWPKLMEGLKATLPPHKYTLKIVVPGNKPESSWIRVYCPFGMSDLFGAYSDKPGSNGAEMSSSGQSNKVYVDNGHDDTMHIDRDLVLPTSRKPWKGINMSMPHDVEGTLRRRYGDEWNVPKYAAKGADTVEGNKPYMKVFRALAKLGIRI